MQAARGTSIADSTTGRGPAASRWLFAAVAVAGLGLDIATKTLAVRFLDPADPPVLFGGLLTLQLIRNPGAAFSLGQGFTPVFSVLSILTLAFVLGFLLPRLGHRGWAVALGLLAAGVAGNLGDRLFRPPGVFFGHVVDFLQLPYWAIFNVADMCVTSAAVLIIFFSIVRNVSLSGRRYTTERSRTEPAAESGPADPADRSRSDQGRSPEARPADRPEPT